MKIYENLPIYRIIGDEEADEIIRQILEREGLEYLKKLMIFWADFKNLDIQHLPDYVLAFFNQNTTYPEFYKKKEIIRSIDFYRTNQQQIAVILGLYSLPYCYLGADGAKVLYFSEKIRKNTFLRLQETGNFVRELMDLEHWTNGKVFTICTKVRLMHASIRIFLLLEKRWDMLWGFPINQEDMLGTNLAFSLIVLRGLEQLGNTVDDNEEQAYIHTWNVIGYLMGIKPELLPHSYADAFKIEQSIAKRQFRESLEGKELTKALLEVFRELAPNDFMADVLQTQCRMFLGDTYANMLGISQTNIPYNLLKIYNQSNTFLSKYF